MINIQIFGTVCIDRVRIINEFPKILGSYTSIIKEHIFLGGEALNSFVCMIKWINKGDESVKLISTPFVNDFNGKLIMNFLKQYSESNNVTYTKIVDNSNNDMNEEKSIEYTPCTDIYVCNEKERTMFGIGFPEVDQYMFGCKELNNKIFNQDLKFGPNNWISIDSNYPLINTEIINNSIKTNTNLYIMDQEIFIDGYDGSLDKYTSSLIFQSSSDHFGNKNGTSEEFLKFMSKWFEKSNGKFKKFLLILTDSKNGFGIGGTWKGNWIEPYWFTPIQIPPSQILDTTGAGDAFRAGLIYSLIYKNSSINDSLEFASVSGGLNCCSLGGSFSTPSLEAINNFLKLHNKNQIN